MPVTHSSTGLTYSPIRSQVTTDPEEATTVCRSLSARRASDKMTIGVICEGALGKPAS